MTLGWCCRNCDAKDIRDHAHAPHECGGTHVRTSVSAADSQRGIMELEQHVKQLQDALHFWLKRIHVSSLSKRDLEQFSKDSQLSRSE